MLSSRYSRSILDLFLSQIIFSVSPQRSPWADSQRLTRGLCELSKMCLPSSVLASVLPCSRKGARFMLLIGLLNGHPAAVNALHDRGEPFTHSQKCLSHVNMMSASYPPPSAGHAGVYRRLTRADRPHPLQGTHAPYREYFARCGRPSVLRSRRVQATKCGGIPLTHPYTFRTTIVVCIGLISAQPMRHAYCTPTDF